MKSPLENKCPSLDKILEAGVDAANSAGKILIRHFQSKLRVTEKKNAGLVTNADFESQDRAVKILKKAIPGFGFLTEEGEQEKSTANGRWIIDPLDGTTNYIHGFPMFCVSIAAEWKGKIVAGIIHHPILGDTYTAALGSGAFLNGNKIQVSKTKILENALLSTGFAYHGNKTLRTEMSAFEKLSHTVRAIRRPGSAALDLAYTACGVFDGFWERGLSPWDVAAGFLLVTEAGGKVTDFKGGQFKIDRKELLASNPHIHKSLVAEISQ